MAMKKKISILIGFLIVVMIVLYLQWFRLFKNEPKVSSVKILHYKYILSNTTNRSIRNVEFYTYAPAKKTAFQRCIKIETSIPNRVVSDSLNNQVLQFKFSRFPPYGNKIISISAVVEMFDRPAAAKLSESEKWLASEKWVESEDPLIVEKMMTLKKRDCKKTIDALYHFVSGHISYSGYLRNERGARYALVHRKGDCTEYTDLFTALCRAGGIPAKRVGGYICRQADCRLAGNRYHNWAQVLIEKKWHVVDPQNRVFNEHPSDYIVMKIIGTHEDRSIPEFHRFKISGDGIVAKMVS
jgi:transglutaminase/protease-like cytokinesis protein 3